MSLALPLGKIIKRARKESPGRLMCATDVDVEGLGQTVLFIHDSCEGGWETGGLEVVAGLRLSSTFDGARALSELSINALQPHSASFEVLPARGVKGVDGC